jgi:hypothetical protein
VASTDLHGCFSMTWLRRSQVRAQLGLFSAMSLRDYERPVCRPWTQLQPGESHAAPPIKGGQ